MNKSMLDRLLWQQCILRPAVRSIFPKNRWGVNPVRLRDWPWLVVHRTRRSLSLQNATTGHTFELTKDHIHEYLENLPGRPGFLMLKSQVWITSSDVGLEPMVNWRPSTTIL